jgi:hypothetical protein
MQIVKEDSTKSALSRLESDQAALFNLLTTNNFEIDGTPELKPFRAKLVESSNPMWSIDMVRQKTRLWGGVGPSPTRASYISSLAQATLPQI